MRGWRDLSPVRVTKGDESSSVAHFTRPRGIFMLCNEKGSFRGSSDQRGEHPGHLHNCRSSEHGQPSSGCPTWAAHRGLLFASPGGPGEARRGGRLADRAPAGKRRGLPGEGDTEARGSGRGAGAWLRCPTTQSSRGLRRVTTPASVRDQAVPRSPGAAPVPCCCRCDGGAGGDWLPVHTRPHLRRGASTSPPRATGGWLPARRLAPPPASGDKGIKRHARSAGRGGAVGRLQPPASPARLRRRLHPPPRGAAPRRLRQRAVTGRARGGSLFP